MEKKIPSPKTIAQTMENFTFSGLTKIDRDYCEGEWEDLQHAA